MGGSITCYYSVGCHQDQIWSQNRSIISGPYTSNSIYRPVRYPSAPREEDERPWERGWRYSYGCAAWFSKSRPLYRQNMPFSKPFSHPGPISGKCRKLFGPEKPFLKMWSILAYTKKLIFDHDFKVRNSLRIQPPLRAPIACSVWAGEVAVFAA